MAISATMVKDLREKTGAGMMDCKAALATDGSLAAILDAKLHGGPKVSEAIQASIATIGENISLRRAASLKVSQGAVASYVHSAIATGLGKIGVIVGLESSGNADKLAQIGKQIAMHVAAAGPLAVRTSELDPSVVSRERAVFAEQARESGKPAAVIEKMVEGRMRKFYEESVLLSQIFQSADSDGKTTVGKMVENLGKELGKPVEVVGFLRFAVGEGIEKASGDDFADEVNKLAGR